MCGDGQAGLENQATVFLVEDSQLIDKLMLADIEMMVSKGRRKTI